MRIISITRDDNGETRNIQIRALKRREIKPLQKYGYSYARVDFEKASSDEAIDEVFGQVLSAQDIEFLDECENHQASNVLLEIIKETYGSKEEEKNLSATTSGTPTESASNTAEPAKDTTKSLPPA